VKLNGLRSDITETALEGISPSDANRMLAQLEAIKENLRNAIQDAEDARKEQRYG
jgi:MarR family transcriptional regulator, transcriptional regulator for hemolysin